MLRLFSVLLFSVLLFSVLLFYVLLLSVVLLSVVLLLFLAESPLWLRNYQRAISIMPLLLRNCLR